MNPGDTCTPTYGLPFATGVSRPCNIGSTSCAFATAVEEQLDALDAVAGRLQNIPFAYGSNIAEMVYNNSIPGNFVPFFDTTMADTDNMIDLSLNPSVITINTPGVYSFFINAEVSVSVGGTDLTWNPIIKNTSGSGVLDPSVQITSFTSSPNMPLRTDGTRVANICFTGEFMGNVGAGYTFSSFLNVGGPANTLSFIQAYRAGAIWLRDPL